MPSMTDSFENAITNYFLRGGIGSGVYLGISTTTPTETGTNFTEPSTSNGYGRQAITFSNPTTGTCSNTNVITFGPCTNTSWGSISYIGIFSASTGGTLYMTKIVAARTVSVGDSISYQVGDITVTFD